MARACQNIIEPAYDFMFTPAGGQRCRSERSSRNGNRLDADQRDQDLVAYRRRMAHSCVKQAMLLRDTVGRPRAPISQQTADELGKATRLDVLCNSTAFRQRIVWLPRSSIISEPLQDALAGYVHNGFASEACDCQGFVFAFLIAIGRKVNPHASFDSLPQRDRRGNLCCHAAVCRCGSR